MIDLRKLYGAYYKVDQGDAAKGRPDEEGEPHYPNRFSLEANYPNPFNQSTIINYSHSEPADVVIVIYDILGRKVHTLHSSNQQPGRH